MHTEICSWNRTTILQVWKFIAWCRQTSGQLKWGGEASTITEATSIHWGRFWRQERRTSCPELPCCQRSVTLSSQLRVLSLLNLCLNHKKSNQASFSSLACWNQQRKRAESCIWCKVCPAFILCRCCADPRSHKYFPSQGHCERIGMGPRRQWGCNNWWENREYGALRGFTLQALILGLPCKLGLYYLTKPDWWSGSCDVHDCTIVCCSMCSSNMWCLLQNVARHCDLNIYGVHIAILVVCQFTQALKVYTVNAMLVFDPMTLSEPR